MGGRGGSSASNSTQTQNSRWVHYSADYGSVIEGAGGFHFDQAIDAISGPAPFATPQNRVSMQLTEDYNLSVHDAGVVNQMRMQYEQAGEYLKEANRSKSASTKSANRDRAQVAIDSAVDLGRSLNIPASDVTSILNTLDRVYVSGTGYTTRR